jgi:hypothetical protein
MVKLIVAWTPILFLVVALAIWGDAWRDFAATDQADMRTFSRPAWLAILTFGSVLGALAWLYAGRPESRRR